MSSTVAQTRFTANDGLLDRRGHVNAPGSECDVQSNRHRDASPHDERPVRTTRRNCVTEAGDFETTGRLRVDAQELVALEAANGIVECEASPIWCSQREHPKMQQALAWIPAQDQEPRAVRRII
jgi:hypothetical protein